MVIAIVGGGVAGSYCAYRLSHASPARSVQLFEASDRIGGRLWSVALDGVAGSPAEIGGMFFGDMQRNVFGLIDQELKLPYAPVTWTRRHQYLRGKYLTDDSYSDGAAVPFNLPPREAGKGPVELLLYAIDAIVPNFMDLWPMDRSRPDQTPRATIARLRGIVYDGRNLWDWGFWNLLSAVVSNEGYNLLLATLGSSSVFRNANAYDAIWTFMHESSQDFYKITAGYQTLPETLVNRAGPTCNVHMEHRLFRVERRKNKFLLHFETDNGVSTVKADQLILAMPRRSIELIDIDETILDSDVRRNMREAVIPVPACKLFLTFDGPWWDASAIGPTLLDAKEVAAAYTDLPMRQCYYFGAPGPSEPALLMATYADDVATSFWAGLRHPTYCQLRSPPTPSRRGLCTSIAMEDAAQRQLSAMHHDCTVPEPSDGLFFDWSDDPYGGAWHAWAPYVKSWEVIAQVRQPNPELDFYVGGEAFAQLQGWVEGALNNAEMVLQRLGLDRPHWISADYEFEHEKETGMSSKLSDLLVDLSEDLKLQKAYAKDPKVVMTKYRLSKAEKDALSSGDEARILAAIDARSGVRIFKIVVRSAPPKPKAKAKTKPKAKAKPQAK